MRYAGLSEGDPLLFEWRDVDDVPFEPTYGQHGANLRYEITHAAPPESWGRRGLGNMREKKDLVRIKCAFKPYARGLPQLVATASGGVIEDKIGRADGLSRGLIVPKICTNKFTNPVFGHATYNNNWTAGADLLVAENKDPEFILFGDTSVKLVAESGTDANLNFHQALDVGNTNSHTFSFYAKAIDGSALTTSNIKFKYSTVQTADAVLSVGDGWYRVVAKVTGIASSQHTGVILTEEAQTIFIDGFQIEEEDYPTPLCFGDMLGCSWSSTAHASTSSRTIGKVAFDPSDIMNLGEGTIRVAIKHPFAHSIYDLNQYAFTVDATNDMQLYWNQTLADWVWTDGTNLVATSDHTFAANDVEVLHATYGKAGIALYINGAEKSTDTSSQPLLSVANAYVGGHPTTTGASAWTIMDLAIYDRAMTATQVAADYANIQPIVEGDVRASPIPWLWTKDGDDITDNCNDSTRDNYCVIDGVPGTIPAKTKFDLTRSFNSTTQTILSLLTMQTWRDPLGTVFFDLQDITDTGNSCGDEYDDSIPIGDTANFNGSGLVNPDYEVLAGREVRAFIRSAFFATTGPLKVVLKYGSLATSQVRSKGRNVTGLGTSVWRLYYSDLFGLPPMSEFFLDSADLKFDGTDEYFMIEIVGGAGEYRADYIALFTRPLMVLEPSVATASGTQSVMLEGYKAVTYISGEPEAVVYVSGDEIELVPDQLNLLSSLHGDTGADADVDYTMTYNEVLVTPRWEVS